MSTNKQRQLTDTLLAFYNQPVARASLELLLTIGTVAFFALFAIRPTLLTMSNLIKELDDKKVLDTQLSEKIASLQSSQIQYAQLEQRLPLLDEAIPLRPQFYEAIVLVEKVASDNNLVIQNLSLQTIPADKELDQPLTSQTRQFLPFRVTLSGDYESIKNFVSQVQSLRRLFTVESIVFNAKEEKQQRRLEATLNIYAYYYGVDPK
jgi:type IV pilus assembly protein PilO